MNSSIFFQYFFNCSLVDSLPSVYLLISSTHFVLSPKDYVLQVQCFIILITEMCSMMKMEE